jgi:hypothetical protein
MAGCFCCRGGGVHTEEAEFTLRELVTVRGTRLQLPLQDANDNIRHSMQGLV